MSFQTCPLAAFFVSDNNNSILLVTPVKKFGMIRLLSCSHISYAIHCQVLSTLLSKSTENPATFHHCHLDSVWSEPPSAFIGITVDRLLPGLSAMASQPVLSVATKVLLLKISQKVSLLISKPSIGFLCQVGKNPSSS